MEYALYLAKNVNSIAFSFSLCRIAQTEHSHGIANASLKPAKAGLFKKKEEAASPLTAYLDKLSKKCFVCQKIEEVFERYIVTVFYLYEKEEEFRKTVRGCKGFCNEHYRLLLEESPKQLSAGRLESFSISLIVLSAWVFSIRASPRRFCRPYSSCTCSVQKPML